MLGVVVVFLMLTSSQALPLDELTDQRARCSWGAQYWCSSDTTADFCGKTEWCKENYWSYDVVLDGPCTVMQQLVTNVRMLAKISSHSFLTYNEIAVYIAKGCALLHDGESKNQCKQLITDEDVLMKLLSLIGSDLSTQSVAAAVGVCRRNIPTEKHDSVVACEGLQSCGSSTQNVIKDNTEELVNGTWPTCYFCQLVMQKLQSLLAKNATEKQIEAALRKVCIILPFFTRKTCDSFVSKYTQKLVELLLRYPPSMVCSIIQLCSDTDVVSFSETQESPGINGTTKCFLCKLVINQVKSKLSQHTTQDEIKAALEKVCQRLPPIFRSVCTNVVETYEPQLIQMLLSSFTTEQICQKLKMCKQAQVYVSEVNEPPNVKDTTCFLCKLVINQVKSMLSQHTTEAEIKAALEKVCHQLPPLVVTVCNTLVEEYEPQLVQWFLSSFTSEQICEKLNMCTDVQVMAVNEIQQSPNVKDASCFLCKFIITQVKSLLSQHTTEAEIKAALEKVCHKMPPLVETVCNTMVEEYEPHLVQWLLSSLTSEQICEKLNMCTDVQVVAVNEIQQSPNVKDARCFLCKFIITQVKSLLSQHTTEAEIKAALEKMCHQLPPLFQSVCDNIVETYEPQLIHWFLSSLTSEQICGKLNMCTEEQDKSLTFVSEKNSSPILSSKESCDTCLLTLHIFQSAMKDPFWQSESRAALREFCTYLQDDQELCKVLVDASFSNLSTYIQDIQFPAELCEKADFCEPAGVHKSE